MALKRFGQRLQENMGTAAKTLVDSELDASFKKAMETKDAANKIIDRIKELVQPDTMVRTKSSLGNESMNKYENLGQTLTNSATKIGNKEPLGLGMTSMSETQQAVAAIERNYLRSVDSDIVEELKKYCSQECKKVEAAEKDMNARRLDMDSTKNALRKAKKSEEVAKFEAKLAEQTHAYEEKVEALKNALAAFPALYESLKETLKNFMELQKDFHQKSAEAIEKGLASFP